MIEVMLCMTVLCLTAMIVKMTKKLNSLENSFIQLMARENKHIERVNSLISVAETFTKKQKKDVSDFKRRLTAQEKAIYSEFDKISKKHHVLEKQWGKHFDKNLSIIQDVLEDFHEVSSMLRDGSIQNSSLTPQSEYIKKRTGDKS